MGWDLGRGKLSTVGVAHPGFQFIYLYTVLSIVRAERNCPRWTVFAAYTIPMTVSTRSRAWFYVSRST
jgi:hypothetical protein